MTTPIDDVRAAGYDADLAFGGYDDVPDTYAVTLPPAAPTDQPGRTYVGDTAEAVQAFLENPARES
jgi:hypothetical protein